MFAARKTPRCRPPHPMQGRRMEHDARWTDSTARRDPSPAEYWRPVSRDRDRSPNSCDECAVSRQGAQTATSHCRRWSASGWLSPSSRRDRREPKVLHIESLFNNYCGVSPSWRSFCSALSLIPLRSASGSMVSDSKCSKAFFALSRAKSFCPFAR